MADILKHLAYSYKLIADNFAVLIESHFENVTLYHFEVANALCAGGEDGAYLASKTLAEIFERCANRQTVFGERGLGAAVNNLLEQLAHCYIDSVANEVGVKSLENGLAGKDFACHCCGMGHARAANGLNESFLNDTFFNVKAELAGALLGSTPAHTMGETGNILDFFSLYPFALFGNGSRTMTMQTFYLLHLLNFM